MAARAGMVKLIALLRRLTAVRADDATWTEDVLQDALDRTRVERRGVPVRPVAERSPGQTTYADYLLPPIARDVEYDPNDVAEDGWRLLDVSGQDAPGHTVNLAAGVITFDTPTDGQTFYLDCRAYDLNAAAADVWEQKAAAVAGAVDWRSDNHQVSASQEHSHCLRMAREFRAKAGGGMQSVEMWRSDEAW